MGCYPTDDELKRIEEWPYDDFKGLMEYVESKWEFADWGWRRKGRTYRISTGGWSGNESIIDAMHHNFVFWHMCWESSRKGGHYIFQLPKYQPKEG